MQSGRVSILLPDTLQHVCKRSPLVSMLLQAPRENYNRDRDKENPWRLYIFQQAAQLFLLILILQRSYQECHEVAPANACNVLPLSSLFALQFSMPPWSILQAVL